MSVKEARFRVPLLEYPRPFQNHSIVLRPPALSLKWKDPPPVQDTFLLLTVATNPSHPQYPNLEEVLSFSRVPTQNPNLDHRHDRLSVPGPVSPN